MSNITDEIEVHWYSLTPKLLEGLALSNVVPNTKFLSIISSIFKAAKDKVEKPFTDEELKTLQNTLKLNDNVFRLMLTSLAYIVKRSMQFIIKPTVLEDDLTNKFKFDPIKSEMIVKIWTEYTKADIGDLEKRHTLHKFSWELNLELASDTKIKKAVPCSILQFNIKNHDDKTDNIVVNMDEEQLLEMYNQIENMQSVVDSLT